MPSDCTGPAGPPPPATPTSEDDPERDLAGALHEVSNALTVVMGWVDRVRSRDDVDVDVRRALEIAHSRALDGRRIARRAIGADVEPIAEEELVAELVSEALTGVWPEANDKGITLQSASSGPHDDALVEEARTALQVLTNLLLNAIAFSPRDVAVFVESETSAGEISFRVRDEGPGIHPDRKDRVFSRGRTTRSGGAGIGLVHARALARRHGGDLTLEPSPRGACFLLRWPRAAARSTRATALRAHTALGGMRILVVEDDAAVLILLETALTARDADVVCARTDQELAGALAGEPYHAALVDLSPIAADIGGHMRALRAHSPGARVVVISGSAVVPPDQAVLQATAWVRKPFDLGEILASLSDAPKLTQAS